MQEVPVARRPLEPFDAVLGRERRIAFAASLHRLAAWMAGRTLWHINATSKGGGVAKLISSALGYAAAGGVDAILLARCLVTDAQTRWNELISRLGGRERASPAR